MHGSTKHRHDAASGKSPPAQLVADGASVKAAAVSDSLQRTAVQPDRKRGAFLAADIGGTHARLALVACGASGSAPVLLDYLLYRCADHPHLQDLIRCFCERSDVRPRHMVLACAGYEHAGMVVNKNLAWPVIPAQIATALQMDEVCLLNDFEALAHATAHLDESNTTLLKSAQSNMPVQGPVAIIGPGTGLGAAVRFPGNPSRVLATEAGQIQLAARTALEQQLLSHLAMANSHVPYETVLCGPGLHRLYLALCALRDRYPTLNTPAEVSAEALADEKSLAHETLSLFCGWLGSFAGDLALLYGATGGVYLAGGFLSKITEFMRASELVDRFTDKGVMRPLLNRIPIHVVDHGQLGVIGAASWFLQNRAEAGKVSQSVGNEQ
nr:MULTISPECIES: glucokinase [unclassified Rhodanobacter]